MYANLVKNHLTVVGITGKSKESSFFIHKVLYKGMEMTRTGKKKDKMNENSIKILIKPQKTDPHNKGCSNRWSIK